MYVFFKINKLFWYTSMELKKYEYLYTYNIYLFAKSNIFFLLFNVQLKYDISYGRPLKQSIPEYHIASPNFCDLK